MKKLTVTIIGLVVSGLWFLPVQPINAQSEREQVEAEIEQAAFEIRLCSNRIDSIQNGTDWIRDPEARDMLIGGVVVPQGRSSDPEKEIENLGKCIERAKDRLKSLQEKLAKLPPAPATRDPKRPPEEDPERKKLLEGIAEVMKLSEEYGKKMARVKERARRLRPKTGYDVDGESADGLLIGTFTTPYGKVQVFLTNDWRVGDVTTTTIKLEPSGNTEAERSPNLSKLTKMSIEYKPQSYFITTEEMAAPGDNVALEVELNSPIAMEKGVRFAVSEGGRTGSVDLILKDEDGEPKAGFGVPVGPKEDKPALPETTDDTFPKVVQGGAPIEIRLRSNGDTKTEVTIGRQPAQVLAESPRKIIVRCPDNVTGQVEIIVNEGNAQTKGTTRVVGVRLNAGKLNLMRSEKTTVTVEVSGLEGIRKDVPLKLDTKGVVQMDGGNTQNLRIRPQGVKGGRYTTTRGITAQQAGGFSVTATVLHRALIRLTENARENGFRVTKNGYIIENTKDPVTGDLLDGEYVLEYGCVPGTFIKSIIPMLIKKGRAEIKQLCPRGGFGEPTEASGTLFQQSQVELGVRFEF